MDQPTLQFLQGLENRLRQPEPGANQGDQQDSSDHSGDGTQEGSAVQEQHGDAGGNEDPPPVVVAASSSQSQTDSHADTVEESDITSEETSYESSDSFGDQGNQYHLHYRDLAPRLVRIMQDCPVALEQIPYIQDPGKTLTEVYGEALRIITSSYSSPQSIDHRPACQHYWSRVNVDLTQGPEQGSWRSKTIEDDVFNAFVSNPEQATPANIKQYIANYNGWNISPAHRAGLYANTISSVKARLRVSSQDMLQDLALSQGRKLFNIIRPVVLAVVSELSGARTSQTDARPASGRTNSQIDWSVGLRKIYGAIYGYFGTRRQRPVKAGF